MARALTPQDRHALMNSLVEEATGQQASIVATDTSSFVSAGELVLATGMENTLNALSLVLGRTFMAVRPYQAKLRLINAIDTGVYSSRLRKISFYAREAEASGDWNTQLFPDNLMMGADNGQGGNTPPTATASMWVQNQPVPLEMNFAGQSVWEECTTVYEDQVKQAFRSEAEFAQFVAGIMTEKGNDIESQKEAFNRMTLLNFMGGVIDINQSGSVRHLLTEFNTRFNSSGTPWTAADVLSTYLKEFCAFFVAEFKKASDRMTYRTKDFHWSPTKTINGVSYELLRHTPKAKQRAVLYQPLFTEAEALVLPEIFNPQYLSLDNYEGVQYWQNFDEPEKISITPAIPDVLGTNNGEQLQGSAVAEDYVIGMLFDEDALMVDYQLEASNTTPLEARKRYRNIWWTFSKNSINDFTENAVIFLLD